MAEIGVAGAEAPTRLDKRCLEPVRGNPFDWAETSEERQGVEALDRLAVDGDLVCNILGPARATAPPLMGGPTVSRRSRGTVE